MQARRGPFGWDFELLERDTREELVRRALNSAKGHSDG